MRGTDGKEVIEQAREILAGKTPDPSLEETLARIERETGVRYVPVRREGEES